MTTLGVWQAGKLYPFGAVVQPLSAPPPAPVAIANAGFESGDVSWTKGTGWSIGTYSGHAFAGTQSAQWDLTGTGDLTATTPLAVVPGQSITAACQVQQGASASGDAGARVALVWYTSGSVFISESLGNLVDSASSGAWKTSTVTATAPANAAFVAVRAKAFRTTGSEKLWVDNFTWNYLTPGGAGGLIYKAVQPNIGASGATEPTWPTTVGVTVVDNEVTWECIAGSVVEWTAKPLFVSGGTEPTWPTEPGDSVVDGSIVWRAITRRVEDVNCPNTKQVAIAESHVFAADEDIVRFCAVINPLDWTTRGDAGFLPVGLQQSNANSIEVLALYRKKLVPMNASTTQLWAIDPDPELMVPVDQIDGAGSTFYRAAVAVGDDLYYLSAQGVRTVGMTGASRNLSWGQVGEPIDEIVRPEIVAAVAAGNDPHAYYYPGLGQYMLAFTQVPPVPDPTSITLWGNAISAGGPALDKTETFNDELDGATEVRIIGYWPEEFTFIYPPDTDPLPVTTGDYGTYTILDTPITLTTATGAGTNYWAAGSQQVSLPSGEILVIVQIDGTNYLAAINNPSAS